MKNLSYIELAYILGGFRKQISEEIELPGSLEIEIKARPESTLVKISFKHAQKGTRVGGAFELSELHRQMEAGDFKGLESIASQIRSSIPETKGKK